MADPRAPGAAACLAAAASPGLAADSASVAGDGVTSGGCGGGGGFVSTQEVVRLDLVQRISYPSHPLCFAIFSVCLR